MVTNKIVFLIFLIHAAFGDDYSNFIDKFKHEFACAKRDDETYYENILQSFFKTASLKFDKHKVRIVAIICLAKSKVVRSLTFL